MSVYKSKNTPFYVYGFQVNGSRFYGSTGKKSKREANAVDKTSSGRPGSKPVRLRFRKAAP